MIWSEADIPDVLIRALQQATCNTFTKISGQPTICELEDYRKIDGIFGSISFTGDRVWTLMLGMPRQTAIAINSIFTGVDIAFESDDMGEVLGELTNVLAGAVIAELVRENFLAYMAFPSVARGHESGLFTPKNVTETRLCFNSIAGKFWVKIIALPLPA